MAAEVVAVAAEHHTAAAAAAEHHTAEVAVVATPIVNIRNSRAFHKGPPLTNEAGLFLSSFA